MNACSAERFVTALALAAACSVVHANAPPNGQTAFGARTITLPSKPATAQTPAVTRGNAPLHTATGVAPGQAGYVHYFLLRMPDDTLEIQVGIELEDQRIAWSFPALGVVISPFLNGETLQAGDKNYDVWHLYGIRPFPGNAAMVRLRKELPGRINPWIKAGIPYCLDDSPQGKCMSCIGLVLRALFPGSGGYPNMPRDFWRTGVAARYTPNDLLLYLTGMLDLPDRNTRLQRIARLALPADLREDLEELVHTIGVGESKPVIAAKKRNRTGALREKL